VQFADYSLRRRLIAVFAIGMLVLQTFAAGLVGAHALSAPSDAVICHGVAGADPAAEPGDAAPAGKAWQDCCDFCTAASAAIVKRPDFLARFVPRQISGVAAYVRPDVVIARATVRAGRSQAPPSRG
jgi:hypothetical protein